MAKTVRGLALAVAGLDPSGGAGLLLDGRALAAAGAQPMGVASCLTVQSASGLVRVAPVAPRLVAEQLAALRRDGAPRAIKTGAIPSTALARIIAAEPTAHRVVDPVLSASAGKGVLGRASAVRTLARGASLVTPNLPEARLLCGRDLPPRDLANTLLAVLGCQAVLVKGGHGRGPIVDWLAHADGIVAIRHRRLRVRAHGTGCALASLVAGRLACRNARAKLCGEELTEHVRWATRTLAGWLQRATRFGSGSQALLPSS